VSDYTHSIRIRASDDFILDHCEVTYFDEARGDYFVLTCDFAALAADGTYDFPAFSSEFLTLAQDVYVSDVSCLAFGAADQVIDFYYKPGFVPVCIGDCDSDGKVTVDELVKGVTIALGTRDVSSCPAFDENSDSLVVVSELIQGVLGSLEGCFAGGGNKNGVAPVTQEECWQRSMSVCVLGVLCFENLLGKCPNVVTPLPELD
jgi:hypothetical protein